MSNFSKPILCALIVAMPSLLQAARTTVAVESLPMAFAEECGEPLRLPAAVSRVDSLLAEAESHVGKRYRYGATGGDAFDCSGYTSYVFGKYGCKLGRSSRGQALQGEAVSREELMPGDLVMFSGRKVSKSRVGHVGIVVSVDRATGDFRFIHASTSRGVTISDFAAERYYAQRYICARRVLTLDDYRQPPVSVGVAVELPEMVGVVRPVQPMNIESLHMPDHGRKAAKKSRRRK